MFLTNETDYAIRIVNCLASAGDKLDAGTVAQKTGVTPRFALKILHRLTAEGIVKSYKGAKGGYALARDRKDITLLEVVEIFCGPVAVSRCQHDEAECTHPSGVCCFRDVFDDVSCYMRERYQNAHF